MHADDGRISGVLECVFSSESEKEVRGVEDGRGTTGEIICMYVREKERLGHSIIFSYLKLLN